MDPFCSAHLSSASSASISGTAAFFNLLARETSARRIWTSSRARRISGSAKSTAKVDGTLRGARQTFVRNLEISQLWMKKWKQIAAALRSEFSRRALISDDLNKRHDRIKAFLRADFARSEFVAFAWHLLFDNLDRAALPAGRLRGSPMKCVATQMRRASTVGCSNVNKNAARGDLAEVQLIRKPRRPMIFLCRFRESAWP